MKRFLIGVASVVLVVTMFIGLVGVEIGSMHLGGYLRRTQKDIDRSVFKQSVAYNEGKLDDLAKYRLEMIKTEDDVEKSAIADYVNSVYANYDLNNIENKDLKVFLDDCRNGVYSIEKESK